MKQSLIILTILLFFNSQAQYSSPLQTVNLNLEYPLYFIKESEESIMKDKWELKNGYNNISLGIGFNKYIKKTSIEIGTSWYTKNYKKKYVPEYAAFTGILKKECSIKYFTLPSISLKRSIYADSLNTFSIKAGMSLIHPYKYKEEVYETKGDYYLQKPEINFQKPCAFFIGIEYKKKITGKFLYRFYSQIEYKTGVDYEVSSHVVNGVKVAYGKLTDDRLFLNFGLSIEYLIVKESWKHIFQSE